jgi:hypothetical protein
MRRAKRGSYEGTDVKERQWQGSEWPLVALYFPSLPSHFPPFRLTDLSSPFTCLHCPRIALSLPSHCLQSSVALSGPLTALSLTSLCPHYPLFTPHCLPSRPTGYSIFALTALALHSLGPNGPLTVPPSLNARAGAGKEGTVEQQGMPGQ